jgi:ankyrin repeat protein
VARAGSYEDALNAARLGEAGALGALLGKGIDPDTVDENGNTLLILAVREGQLSVVQTLLKYKPRLAYRNPAGDSALMLAVLGGHQPIAELLIRAGAPINHPGWTPLHYAAFEGRLELLERLLAAGAELNALSPGSSTALMLAARNGHIEVVRRLLRRPELDLDVVSDSGFTADNWALKYSNSDIAELIRAERTRRGGENPSLTIEID